MLLLYTIKGTTGERKVGVWKGENEKLRESLDLGMSSCWEICQK
jgi:hypothetical protein